MKEKLFTFLDTSPTAFHAVENIKKELLDKSFIELKESDVWNLEQNKKYFVTRNGSSILVFTTPKKFETVQVTATHVDSPAFKIKDNGEIIDHQQIKLNVEKYGGMIVSSWFDRPLSIAGRVLEETDTGLQQRLVNIDKDIAMIPSAAIHLNRTINDGYKYNIQKELLPILGQGELFCLASYLKTEGNLTGKIVGSDMYLYNRQKAISWGMKNEYIASARIDNLECTYALLESISQSQNDTALNIAVMFDNEEVGSRTKQGADSSFLEQTLLRIKECFALSEQEYQSMLAKGFMISVDNAHAYHPNYSELYDITNHPTINQGIVIKHSANQSYTTDAISASIFRTLCQKVHVPTQDFYNHSNNLGGSTLGNVSTAHVSLHSVDIGLPQWAMHSAYEVAGSEDFLDLIKVLMYFYNHQIVVYNENVVIA
jgi:aspartyl aminopeptidase